MYYFSFLTVALLLVLALCWALWTRARSIGFLLGIGVLYYWSLYGAWTIVADGQEGASGRRYHYLYEKVFPIFLDEHYAWTLALYLTFILITGLGALFWSTRARLPSTNLRPVVVSHNRIIIVGALAAFASFWIMRDLLVSALQSGSSGYFLTRSTASEHLGWFRIHQVLNRVALVPSSIGLATLLSGGRRRLLTGAASLRTLVAYAGLFGAMFCFCTVLGNKNELAFALFAGCLFYITNSTRPRTFQLLACGVVLLACIGFIDYARRFSVDNIASNASVSELFSSLARLAESNEAYAAHMSLYGIFSHDVPLTYGSSIYNFVASLIPRVVWPDRPPDIYWHYANEVAVVEGQGYSIHHAAGWYLNYGVPGVVLGACVLGRLWAALHNNVVRAAMGRGARVWRIFCAVGFFTFTANFPSLVRTGPEGYKGVLIGSVIVPVAVLTLSRVGPHQLRRRASIGARRLGRMRPSPAPTLCGPRNRIRLARN